MSIISTVFGTHSTRELKRIKPLADKIDALEEEYKKLTDGALRSKTAEFKERLTKGETPDDILPEAFAASREAASRVLGMRPYRVQMIGGVVLYQGRIAEMKTGEGKTLVAVAPSYLMALEGKGVHVVTVNDYLARRDSEWMGKIHRFMGLKVGLIVHGLDNDQRREAYAADVTYATNNELGFDYLRDNMAVERRELVTRGRHFAIVDEVDSILIDEARTPLIISGQGEESADLYRRADEFARRLKKTIVKELDSKEEHEGIEGDYIVDEKAKTATLTQEGIAKAEKFFKVENLTDPENTTLMHHVQQAIKAYGTMKRDVEYVVREGQVVIVDEFTGRLMFGRRYSEGLHQAIEAKENVKIERESKTLATITFQNFFRLYSRLSGMTGTALTEAEEFSAIYKLDIIEVPTNEPMIRDDMNDVVFKNVPGKLRAIVEQIKQCHEKGQPVLVGTVSIESSETLSKELKREGIEHSVLNAKHHDREAEIIAQAGRFGAVTIATNMAGRGTDIKLGGNAEYLARKDLEREGMTDEVVSEALSHAETSDADILEARKKYDVYYNKHKDETDRNAEKVREAGGLFILGTERHESRRIDNQLRGRAGRQGDPGASRFFISMEDDLMRLFGASKFEGMLRIMPDDEPIDAKILSGAIETAQRRVESRNFQTRKFVLQYDDVMNKQREIIYRERAKVLEGEDLQRQIMGMVSGKIDKEVHDVFGEHGAIESAEQLDALDSRFYGLFLKPGERKHTPESIRSLTIEDVAEELKKLAAEMYGIRESLFQNRGIDMRGVERAVLLRSVDAHWMDHIDAMQELRQGIGLRAYAQTDPVKAYTSEGFEMFEAMNADIRDETVRLMYSVAPVERSAQRERVARITGESGGDDGTVKKKPVKAGVKVGVNDPCPCGSGLKYKKCNCEKYHPKKV